MYGQKTSLSLRFHWLPQVNRAKSDRNIRLRVSRLHFLISPRLASTRPFVNQKKRRLRCDMHRCTCCPIQETNKETNKPFLERLSDYIGAQENRRNKFAASHDRTSDQ